ncbi:MAG: hypothetical protein Kow0062_05360 [Acidobacteriota bacterium]
MGERTPEPNGPEPDGKEIPLAGGGVLRKAGDAAAAADEPPLPVGFADLVRPFWLMGLASLGVVPDPESGEAVVDLPRARAAIETLELLREKTRGHLDEQESRMLEQSLYELKMQFVGARDRARGE